MPTAEHETPGPAPSFTGLGLPQPLLAALADVGYETPSPIQAATIPPLLASRDVLGQAQTGTGKTAAFALPILARIDPARTLPQALVLAPTRELAIQVAEAFQRYAAHLPGFHVLPIYGGQGYGAQLAGLRRGSHVVVGTPGRVIDHLERGSLNLSGLSPLVLDEADEMLRMGFIDDVETVLKKTPPERQVALFSATMPAPIRRIAQTYLREPVEIAIKARTTTATNIRQRYWYVSGLHKLDALTRILEAESFEAMIVFARTKQATEELAEKLQARGFSAAAINGDIAQPQRERTIQQLKDGKLDILVATDVAARGLDVERISHVLNYDIPYDTEAYVHRIGRTGRAGRSGEAILFVTPREKRMLQAIERATRQPIEEMRLPTVEAVNDRRIAKFRQRITDNLAEGGLDAYRQIVEGYVQEHDVPAIEVAAALARIAHGPQPLLLEARREPRAIAPEAASPSRAREAMPERSGRSSPRPSRREPAPPHDDREAVAAAADDMPIERPRPPRAKREPRPREEGFETFRIEVGHADGVQPGNIVGAIANEAGLDSQYIGRVEIRDDHSLVDLPQGMPHEIFRHLKKVWVRGKQLRITRVGDEADSGGRMRAPRRSPAGDRANVAKPSRPPRKPPVDGNRPPRKPRAK